MNSLAIFSANFSDKKAGKSCILYGLDDVYTHVAVVKLGSHSANFNVREEIDERREKVRIAVAGALLHGTPHAPLFFFYTSTTD